MDWNFIQDGDTPTFTMLDDGSNTVDPVFELNGKYGFCDETWADSYGPFESYAEAKAALGRYAATL